MGTLIDLTGKRFGYLEVIGRAGTTTNGSVKWRCKCICGNIKDINGTSLRKGTKDCGCRFKDITGSKSGELTAIEYVGRINNRHVWKCKCTCGNTKDVEGWKITNKYIKSCGCKEGNYKHGMKGTRIYYIWNAMKQRCSNKKFKDYHIYGGRGITYCNDWETFEGFYDDMGKSYIEHIEKYGAKDTTLDRINPDKNYCKENCRWATIEEQSYNKRETIREEIDGQLLTLKEISLKYNLPLTTLYSRYEKGYRGKELARPYGQKIK